MTDSPNNADRVLDLAESIFDDGASPEMLAELDNILLADGDSRDRYLDYCRLQVALRLELRAERATSRTHRTIEVESAYPAVIPSNAPVGGVFHNALNATVGFFSHELALSLLVATLVMSSALLLAWKFNITHYRQVAVTGSPADANGQAADAEYVGRITGMEDCRWNDPDTAPLAGAAVSLGREYSLESGLLEITYTSGARVIIEGPCKYKADSTAGGYLAVGKLTARVEGRGKSEKRRVADAKPQAAYPQSLIPNHQSLFSVRTPTAVVTDLGTEFGVKVDKEGHTATLVFSGTVRIDITDSNAGKEDNSVTLHENESAQTCKHGNSDGSLALRRGSLDPKEFVRRIVKLPKVLDLLDIVAGGDGMGQHRENGINPATGIEDRVLSSQYREAGPGFRPWYLNISWHNLIDGVFVPDGRMGKVQINSAGYRFADFPKTDGKAFSSVWARAASVGKAGRNANRGQWIYAIESTERYMPDNRGLLGLHANAGITFDLGAMRVAYRGVRPARFRATAALADTNGAVADQPDFGQSADVWVFVDNQLKLHRLHLSPRDGVLAVDIELGPKDRFLTLASTDGGNGSLNDWVVFGDPILEMIPIEEDANCGRLEKSEEKER